MEVQVLEREFNYNGVKLPDPNPQMSVEEVKEMYSAQYPQDTWFKMRTTAED